MTKGSLNSLKKSEKASGFKCGTFGASTNEQRHLATGSFDGSMFVWDLERLDIPIYSTKKHNGLINCIDGVGGLVGDGAPEIVTGGRDGSVKVWDTRQRDDPVVDISPEDGAPARDCWAVAFGNSIESERCVAAGYDNGDLKLFDLRAMKARWEHTLPNGICSIEFDRKDIEMNKMVVTGLESQFHVFDMRTFHEEEGYAYISEKAHKSTIWQGAHLPQDRDVFMTCGGNGSVNLWKYSYPANRRVEGEDGKQRGVAGTVQLINSAVISTQPINCFDWNRHMRGLCLTTSFDETARVCFVTNLNLV
jgi:WD40 repeat protein